MKKFLQGVARWMLRDELAELRKNALFDPLTGCYSRQGMDNIVEEEKTQQRHGVVGVLYVDLDGFKRINDEYGHAAGDKILCEAADAMRKVCRKQDVIIRRGGDEFIVVLCRGSSVEEDDLGAVAEKIRAAVAAQNIYSITASVGFTLIRKDEVISESTFERADHALYVSKESGKNRVTVVD